MEFQGEVRAGAPLGGECGQVAVPSGGALTGRDMLLEDTWKDVGVNEDGCHRSSGAGE